MLLLQLFTKVIGAFAVAISVKFVTSESRVTPQCRQVGFTVRVQAFSPKVIALLPPYPLYPEKCMVPWRSILREGKACEWADAVRREEEREGESPI